jgi:hypothetical protein
MSLVQASRFRRRIPFVLFALFLAGVAAVTGLWFVGAEMVREQITSFGRDLAAEGGAFTTSSLRITGFPFSFTAHATDIRMSGRNRRGLWHWQAARGSARLSPWRVDDVSFDLAGAHRLRFHAGPVPLNLEITAKTAPGVFSRGTADSPRRVTLRPTAMAVHAPAKDWRLRLDSAEIKLYRQWQRPSTDRDALSGLSLSIQGMELPDGDGAILGRKVEKFSAAFQVKGEPPLPLDRGRLRRWHNAGGALEVKELGLTWGPTRIDATGTVTLNDALQPEASFTAHVVGYDEAVDALVKTGAVRAQAAEGLKLMLAMMARQSSPDRAREIRMPMSIQDRAIYIGPARLARMPRIRW